MVGTCDYQKELYTSNYNVQNRLTAKGARLELPVLTQSPVRWPITEVFKLVVRKNLKSADACAQIPSVFRALGCQEHHLNRSSVQICLVSA